MTPAQELATEYVTVQVYTNTPGEKPNLVGEDKIYMRDHLRFDEVLEPFVLPLGQTGIVVKG